MVYFMKYKEKFIFLFACQ